MTAVSNEEVLTVRDVNLSYRQGERNVLALANISLTITSGSFIGLVGPSGSGKSSLLTILGLVQRPDSGQVYLAGSPVNFEKESSLRRLRRTAIGFVFQRFNLLPTLSAKENVMVGLRLSGATAIYASERADALLEEVGLADRRHHLPEQLSGGEMQRVAVCRAVGHNPKIILADEPTGNLDSHSGARVLELLARTTKTGTAVLMATHSAEAQRYCSAVFQLKDGRLT